MTRERSDTKGTVILVATRKGAWTYRASRSRTTWRCSGPLFLGQVIHHFVADPRDERTWLAAVSTGHLGPTIMRSRDRGRTWQEAKRPPAFPKAAAATGARAVNHTF
ncbi:MAG: glycosyl hydrolase, partial [Gammaproteobacteria bacterium]|nr:glycosyl hydrolase [Gammaproteobacteria bacterium]